MTKAHSALQRTLLGLTAVFAVSFIALLFAVLPYYAEAALINQQLDLGDSNSDVTALQTFLASDSTLYPEGLVTGYFGSLTESAVKRYQARHGLAQVGRVGPQTLASINGTTGGGGTVSTGDIDAPRIFPENVSTTQNSATISWSTSESARSRVMYGTTWPFLYSTAPSVSTNSYGSSANITLTGLQPNSRYYYVLESIDGSGNVMWTVGKPLNTQ